MYIAGSIGFVYIWFMHHRYSKECYYKLYLLLYVDCSRRYTMKVVRKDRAGCYVSYDLYPKELRCPQIGCSWILDGCTYFTARFVLSSFFPIYKS